MKTLFKILGIVLGLIVVLLVVAVVAVTVLIDPNQYRGRIEQAAQELTGRALTISGDLELSFFPWLGVQAGRTDFANAEGFGDQPMARIENLGAKVKVLPLLSGQVVMDTVIMEGLHLNLVRGADGRTNFDDLAQPAETPKEPSPEGGGPGLNAVDIQGLEVRDSRISWVDRQADTQLVADKLSLETGALRPGEAFRVALEFELIQRPDPRPRPVSLQTMVDLGPEGKKLTLKELQLNLAGLELEGEATVTGLDTEPQVKAFIQAQEFSPRKWMESMQWELPATADETVLGKAGFQAAIEADADKARLKDVVIQVDDTTVKGELNVTNFDQPAIRFQWAVDQLNLDRYLPPAAEEDQEGAPTKDTGAEPANGGQEESLPLQALRELNIKGELTIAQLQAFNLQSQNVKLTVNAADGVLQLKPTSAELYQGRYEGSMQLDVRKQTPRFSATEKLTGIQAGPLIKDLTQDKAWLTGTAEVNASVSAQGVDADAMRKTLNGDARFQFTDGAVQGVNVAQLVRDAYGALRGGGSGGGGGGNEPKQTDFSSLSGSARITNGVVTNDDLELKSPLIRITGNGQADLVQEKLDYLVKALLVASLEGQGGRGLEELKGVPIPVRIQGAFADPKFSVDLKEALTGAQKKVVEEKIEEKKQEVREKAEQKLQEKLGDKLGDQLGDKLPGLFGR